MKTVDAHIQVENGFACYAWHSGNVLVTRTNSFIELTVSSLMTHQISYIKIALFENVFHYFFSIPIDRIYV